MSESLIHIALSTKIRNFPQKLPPRQKKALKGMARGIYIEKLKSWN